MSQVRCMQCGHPADYSYAQVQIAKIHCHNCGFSTLSAQVAVTGNANEIGTLLVGIGMAAIGLAGLVVLLDALQSVGDERIEPYRKLTQHY